MVQLKITNHGSEIAKDFVFKLNVNYFGLEVIEKIPSTFSVNPG